jgi:hypothetical protein
VPGESGFGGFCHLDLMCHKWGQTSDARLQTSDLRLRTRPARSGPALVRATHLIVVSSAVPSRACAGRAREGSGFVRPPGSNVAPARTQVPRQSLLRASREPRLLGMTVL